MKARDMIEFWQIDELMLGRSILTISKFYAFLLDPCCALKFYPSIEECQRVNVYLNTHFWLIFIIII